MRRAMAVLIGMGIPALCWGKCCWERNAACPSQNARTVIRDVSQGAAPDPYLTEPAARDYRKMNQMERARLTEIREPDPSMRELLAIDDPDMSRLDDRGGDVLDRTHRHEPWEPYASVERSPDR